MDDDAMSLSFHFVNQAILGFSSDFAADCSRFILACVPFCGLPPCFRLFPAMLLFLVPVLVSCPYHRMRLSRSLRLVRVSRRCTCQTNRLYNAR